MIQNIQNVVFSIEKFVELIYCWLTNAEAVIIYRVYFNSFGDARLYDNSLRWTMPARFNHLENALTVKFFRIYHNSQIHYNRKWFVWLHLCLNEQTGYCAMTSTLRPYAERSTSRWYYIDKGKNLLQQLQQEII